MIDTPLVTDLQVSCLSVYDGDGFLGIGLDGEAAVSKLPPAQALHPFGFLGRPRDPATDSNGNVDPAKGCLVLRYTEGNVDHAIVLNDPRTAGHLPQVGKGGSLQYADTGATDLPYVLCNPDDGSITIHVPSTTKVTIEVAGGPSLTIDNGAVQAGAPGGFPAVYDAGLTAFLQAVSTALGAAGHPVGPAPPIAATKVKVT